MGDREFLIFIANQTAERAANVIKWSGGNGVPVYRDYAVSMFGIESQKRVNLSIAITADPIDWETSYSDAILNGFEIFKFNRTIRNPYNEAQAISRRRKRKRKVLLFIYLCVEKEIIEFFNFCAFKILHLELLKL